MKIIVLSDTHIPVFSRDLSKKIYEYLEKCDCIVHAGDILEMAVVEKLRSIARTYAVKGNMDGYAVKKNLPEKVEFTVNGLRIGVTHGKGSADRARENAGAVFDVRPDIIIFGHSHEPYSKKEEGTLYFNPGSATGGVFSGGGTFGLLEIGEDGSVRAEILESS